MRLLGVRIETPDVGAAAERYATLLGVAPQSRADGARRFALQRGLVELAAGTAGQATILFARERAEDAFVSDPAAHGVAFRVEDAPPVAPVSIGPVEAIDHVVIFTADPARAIGRRGRYLKWFQRFQRFHSSMVGFQRFNSKLNRGTVEPFGTLEPTES